MQGTVTVWSVKYQLIKVHYILTNSRQVVDNFITGFNGASAQQYQTKELLTAPITFELSPLTSPERASYHGYSQWLFRTKLFLVVSSITKLYQKLRNLAGRVNIPHPTPHTFWCDFCQAQPKLSLSGAGLSWSNFPIIRPATNPQVSFNIGSSWNPSQQNSIPTMLRYTKFGPNLFCNIWPKLTNST